jgi:3'-phosphoadenosine 5'-phosphosulfate sulfotransferase (PAPS reductase)/FAD synthetase
MEKYFIINENNEEQFDNDWFFEDKGEYPVIAWWSGGITSAVTCKICIDIYGLDNVRIIFIDTFNEDDDTYRFKKDCEDWYGKPIETITGIGEKYNKIEDVWVKHKSLNVATGAICSSTLKRRVREKWQKENKFKYQAFGFELDEIRRVKSMALNNPNINPVFPLMLYGYTKKNCIDIVEKEGIEVPRMYKLGFLNNNCFKTGCVQGGIGYWQKMKRDFPDKFDKMAEIEHRLTDEKKEPVTMLKDQSKGGGLVFLKPHKDYPQIKDISMMKGREPKPLFECNGFCGINDLEDRSSTEKEINYQQKLF